MMVGNDGTLGCFTRMETLFLLWKQVSQVFYEELNKLSLKEALKVSAQGTTLPLNKSDSIWLMLFSSHSLFVSTRKSSCASKRSKI